MKKCNKCGIEKELTDYYFRKDTQRYFTICKDCCKKKSKKHYEDNKDYYRSYHKKYRCENKEYLDDYMKKHSKIYYQNHKTERQSLQREYYQNHKDYIKTYNAMYIKNKRKNDKVFAMKRDISTKLRKVFNSKGEYCNRKLRHITGLTSDELYTHLLETFVNNYGYEWKDSIDVHIDHIEPLAKAKSVEDVIKFNHYSNLQLLTPEDNMKKWKH